jgi:hypothetical protein
VRNAISGFTPARDFTGLAKLARQGGKDAVDGLKVASWEDALRRSSTETGGLSFERLESTLFNPVRPGQPSLMQMMQQHGLMTAEESARAADLIKRAQRIELAMESGGKGPHWEKIVGNPDAFQDLVIRIVGAKGGSAIASAIPGEFTAGHGLIAASAGSSYARKVLEKVPTGKVKDVLIEAATNPQLMSTMLMQPKTKTEGIAIARQLHAYLLQAGLVPTSVLEGDRPKQEKQ